MSAMEGEDELECAICFNDISEKTCLPCKCQVALCERCWDRSLCQSFQASGCAKCPTCRSAVRVDFDPEAGDGSGRLVFSKEEAAAAESSDDEDNPFGVREGRSSINAVIDRLAQQSVPVLVRSLRRFGENQPLLRAIARAPAEALRELPLEQLRSRLEAVEPASREPPCTSPEEAVERLLRATGGAKALASTWAAEMAKADEVPAPRCVCGGGLARMSGMDRLVSYLRKSLPRAAIDTPQFQSLIERFVVRGSTGVICDVCEGQVNIKSWVWSCRNGDQTILHAASYDVCEDCFIKHAIAGEENYDGQPASGDAGTSRSERIFAVLAASAAESRSEDLDE